MQLFLWDGRELYFFSVNSLFLCPFLQTRCISQVVLDLCIQSFYFLLWRHHWILWLPKLPLVLTLKGTSWAMLFFWAPTLQSHYVDVSLTSRVQLVHQSRVHHSGLKTSSPLQYSNPANNSIITDQSTRLQTPKTVQLLSSPFPLVNQLLKVSFQNVYSAIPSSFFNLLNHLVHWPPLLPSLSSLGSMLYQFSHSYQSPNPLAALFFIISLWHNVIPTILFLFIWEAEQ